ncbi:MAG: Gfo/Idh/MocA family protein [Planctomycetota bacterium]
MSGIDRSALPVTTSRRGFLGDVSRGMAAATSLGALVGGAGLRNAHAAGEDEIRVAVIGCGGRGTGATLDALSVPGGNLKVVAMADVFPERLSIKRQSLLAQEEFKDRIDVPEERSFIGFDAYKQAIDCLRPGDIALFATPPAFRAVHFAYAIEKGVHSFMEKPVAVDGASAKRIMELAGKADEKNLKVGVGLMCRHCDRRTELKQRLDAGEAGDLIAFRGYRNHNPFHNLDLSPGHGEMPEVLWQVRRFHNFLWGSGGIFSDYCIHHIDEVCWMKGAWPVTAEAIGGRHFQGKVNDQNFDNYAIEYTFPDGAKFFYQSRIMKDCKQEFGVFGQGAKGAFTISTSGHSPAKSTIYKSQRMDADNVLWAAQQPEPNPYRREWEHLVAAIRSGEPYNEAVRGAEASLVTAMGRIAAHIGKPLTYQEALDWGDDLTAGVADLTADGPAPVQADADGRYPVPDPGRFKFEYRS